MSNLRYQLVYTLCGLCAVIFASCSSPAEEIRREDMIQPGDKIGEAVLRNVVDESEIRPFLFELCDDLEFVELPEEKTVECVIDYRPTIFLTRGMFEPDVEKLNEYWNKMSFEVTINGQPVDLESFGTIDTLGGRWWNILLENPTSDSIEIGNVVTIHEEPVKKYGATQVLIVLAPNGAGSVRREEPSLLTASSIEAGQHAYHSEKADLDYLMFIPAHYQANPDQQWSLILYLHGAFSGTDVNDLRLGSLPNKLESERTFPSIVVSST